MKTGKLEVLNLAFALIYSVLLESEGRSSEMVYSAIMVDRGVQVVDRNIFIRTFVNH